MLILGCGNPDRGDDAAGLLVARRLRESGVAAEEFEGDGVALVERWSGEDDVVVVDAVVTGQPPGTLSMWDARACNVAASAFCSTHGFGVGEALGLGRALGRLPRRLRICGIEGARFETGSPPGPEVMAGVERAVSHFLSSDASESLPLQQVIESNQ